MELVVLSGKGGTGKTTIAAALSELAKDCIKVDCDVDAPNLCLFYEGNDIKKENFYGGKKSEINQALCIRCGTCKRYCRFNAISNFKVDPLKCEGCGACVLVCPENAIKLKETKTADVFITRTKKGLISRAEMEVGSEGSGKLITTLRLNARKFKDESQITIVDGSPGIGCPVISSITSSDAALIVTEPTVSGLEDFIRVSEICRYFRVTIMVCINKYDLNTEVTNEIKRFCSENTLKVVGEIPYDDTVIQSINELRPIIYYGESHANTAIRDMWENIKSNMDIPYNLEEENI